MNKKEYLKYNNPFAFDKLGKSVKPGDTVVINNHYGTGPYIGIVSHYTQSGLLAIIYEHKYFNGKSYKGKAYRKANTVVKLKSGKNKKQ